MGLIRLKNVSKYYYSKGIITSGLSRINLDINAGEFVVITGESGSGKSTLLNVIAGLDSYEDGEMYIEGCETSHYTTADFEEYRQKYISCIFQKGIRNRGMKLNIGLWISQTVSKSVRM